MTGTSEQHPLLHPDEEQGVWNYPICSAITGAGTPCRGRAQRHYMDRSFVPCPPHQSAAYKAELESYYDQRTAAYTPEPVGDALRTDIPDSLLDISVTLIDPATGRYAATTATQRVMVADPASGDRPLIMVWRGQWRSDAFTITAEQARARLIKQGKQARA